MRFGIGHNYIGYPHEVDWPAIKVLANKHGLSAIVLDGVNEVRKYNDNANVLPGSEGDTACDQRGANFDLNIPQVLLLQWIGEVVRNYEQRYVQYEKAIGRLAGWYNQHAYKMMVLKGYGCSLNWPRPEHRPCGDIDIWLFGKQEEADKEMVSGFRFQVSGFKIQVLRLTTRTTITRFFNGRGLRWRIIMTF